MIGHQTCWEQRLRRGQKILSRYLYRNRTGSVSLELAAAVVAASTHLKDIPLLLSLRMLTNYGLKGVET